MSFFRRFQAGHAFPLKHLINQAVVQFPREDEFTDFTLLDKINWPSGNKLIEHQTKCTITSCLKKLTYGEVTW